MRKLSAYLLMSLDGVVEEPDYWMRDFDEDMEAALIEVIHEQDAVLLGRVMYQEWATVWPSATFAPEFASFINNVPKYVVSTTLSSVEEWQPATLIKEHVAQEIATLKQQPGQTIGVHGSIALTRSLIKQDLLDELILVVSPILAGKGRHLLTPEDSVKQLKLVASKSTSTGGLILTYQCQSNLARVASNLNR